MNKGLKWSMALLGMTVATGAVWAAPQDGQAQDPMLERAILERIAPVGRVRSGEFEDVPVERESLSASEVHSQTCAACHTTGAAGAPITGTNGDWAPRAEQGLDTLVDHAINGFGGGAMPPRGGNPNLSDDEIEATIRFMLEESGITL